MNFKKILICTVISALLLSGCNAVNNAELESQPDNGDGYADYAISGVWISYSEVNSMLKSERGFKMEFDTAVKHCKELEITDIYLHVRAYCDSLFKSEYFPQIEGAVGLDYDPLEYAADICHGNGIRLHAWINPYRVSTSFEDVERLNHESPAYRWLNDESDENDINILCQGGIYLNPAEYEVRELVINGIREILGKYEVDGIHFDDYFYPTTDEKFDSESYGKYKGSAENPLPLDEWRRSNVNALISGSYTAVKFFGKDILLSVSPMASIERNYSELYADVGAWVESGCIDAIIPQLYFGYDYPDDNFKFDRLLEEWKKLCEANSEVSLIIGLATYKIGAEDSADSEEWCRDTDIIARQAEACRRDKKVSGYIFFSYTSLFSDNELNSKQREALKAFIEGSK